MDLVKDGQLTQKQIEGYFDVKRKFRQYVNMRIIFFDVPHIYIPLRDELSNLLDMETEEINNMIQEQL